jgi:hypothetical protein
MGFETWARTIEKEKFPRLSALRDRATDRLNNEREVDLYWMLEELHPSFVFIDSRQTTDFIVLYRHLRDRKIKVAILHAMLPATTGLSRPPLNSDVFPDDQYALTKAIHKVKWHQRITMWKKKLMHCGFDDGYLIKRRLKKNQIPEHYISHDFSLLKFPVRNLDEFVIAPREFDFPNSASEPRQHFIGFMTNEMYPAENEYTNARRTILRLRKNENFKIIFCSFGTITPNDSGVIFSFIKKLIQVSARNNYILVVTAKGVPPDIASDRVYIFDFVPQLQVLEDADVFITHGGLNSIREAVHTEVPMLLYPIHPEYDPIGNAARIAYHRLGLRGNAVDDTENEIDEKIKELLSNPLYKRNIRNLKKQDAMYTPANFLTKLNAINALSM